MKNALWSSLAFIQNQKIILTKIKTVTSFYNKHGMGNTGIRSFINQFYPSISHHNKTIKMDRIKRIFNTNSAFITVELRIHFFFKN